MSTGRKSDEIYVGFLLILLGFLYLSNLSHQIDEKQKPTHAQTKQQELENG